MIKKLVETGMIVIASGGGIPVVVDKNCHYKGVEAMIDKDLAGERLAEVIGANVFLILTDVDKVKLNFGNSDERGTRIRRREPLSRSDSREDGHRNRHQPVAG